MNAVFSRSPRLLSYVHLHFASNPELAGRFVDCLTSTSRPRRACEGSAIEEVIEHSVR
jgi:hypothetical protein